MQTTRDLVALVADRNMEAALRGLLPRHQALRIRPLAFEVYVHPQRDPGCLRRAHEFLRPLRQAFDHALVLLDREGCGSTQVATQLEQEIEARLADRGWGERARAVVVDPELENWVWSDSPHVDKFLGWFGRLPPLRQWIFEQGYSDTLDAKPTRPKAAMEAALRLAQVPRSSALYQRLAETVSISRCADRAFLRLRQIVDAWFHSEV